MNILKPALRQAYLAQQAVKLDAGLSWQCPILYQADVKTGARLSARPPFIDNKHVRRWSVSCNKQSRKAFTTMSSRLDSAPGVPSSSSIDTSNIAMSEDKSFHEDEHGTAALIALGSNLGDRFSYIEAALKLMSKRGILPVTVSSLYETKAMYYEDQGAFLNGVCLVRTRLPPLELLDALQAIETDLGRVRTIDKGPRTLDLDIILYGSELLYHERLKVPHIGVLERDFVLRPMADIPGAFDWLTKLLGYSRVQEQLAQFRAVRANESTFTGPKLCPVTVLNDQLPLLAHGQPGRKTHIMAILNITPDSFSDGGKLYSDGSLDTVVTEARAFIAAGATILDIGGQSTRPKAKYLTPDEELSRVLPVLRAIKAMPEAKKVAISIDTFHSTVAEATMEEGADIINDISGGLLDPEMLPIVAKHGKTIVLMHMRGTPSTMTKLTSYPYGVVKGVACELGAQVRKAINAGILPWRIIVDAGIGFAKNQAQNIQLLRRAGDLPDAESSLEGLPWLVGVSRKTFIGNVTGVTDASQRIMGTAAAVTAAIAGGADIVRVHDVQQMAEVCKMADAIYRQS